MNQFEPFAQTATSILAAQDGPPVSGALQPASTTTGTATGAPGAPATGTPAARPAGGLDFITIAMLAVIAFLFINIILGGRREKKKFEQMMASIKKNDQVRTAGGIIGSVVEVKPDVIVLKVDESSNTKITVMRTKIEAIMKESATNA